MVSFINSYLIIQIKFHQLTAQVLNRGRVSEPGVSHLHRPEELVTTASKHRGRLEGYCCRGAGSDVSRDVPERLAQLWLLTAVHGVRTLPVTPSAADRAVHPLPMCTLLS